MASLITKQLRNAFIAVSGIGGAVGLGVMADRETAQMEERCRFSTGNYRPTMDVACGVSGGVGGALAASGLLSLCGLVMPRRQDGGSSSDAT